MATDTATAMVASNLNPEVTEGQGLVRSGSLAAVRRYAGVCLLLAPAAAMAGDWFVQPRLNLNQTWTDNPRLVSEAQRPSSDWITSISPGISVSGQGRRLKLNGDYTAQKQVFKDNSDLSQLTHLLQANSQAEVVRDQVFVTAFASMFPTIRNNLGQVSNRNRNIRNQANRADVISYGFSPEFRHRLGNWVNLSARTNWSDVSTGDQGGSGVGGGQNTDWRFSADSGRRFQRFGWGSEFSRRENDGGDQGRRSVFQRWNNSLNYRLNRFLRLNSSVGYEMNDFQTNGGGLNNGLNWSLGATVNLSPRTSVTGSFGERAFGETKSFSFSHRMRRFIFAGNYNEDLRTTSEVLREQQVFTTLDPFGVPIIDPLTQGDPSIPINQIGLTDDVFISRVFTSSIGYNRRRDSVSMRINRREQESTRSAVNDSLFGIGGTWSHRMSSRLSAGFNADFQIRESDNNAQSSEFLSLSPFVSYTIGPHVSSRLSYQYMDNVSADASDDFTENAVTGSLSVAF